MPRATRNVWKDQARHIKEWASAECSICGRKFQYMIKYPKPRTCGFWDCLVAQNRKDDSETKED